MNRRTANSALLYNTISLRQYRQFSIFVSQEMFVFRLNTNDKNRYFANLDFTRVKITVKILLNVYHHRTWKILVLENYSSSTRVCKHRSRSEQFEQSTGIAEFLLGSCGQVVAG